jgi:hypothetical protein
MVPRNTGKIPTFEAGCTTRIPQPFGLYAKEKLLRFAFAATYSK